MRENLECTAEKTPTTKKYSLRHGLSSDNKKLPIQPSGGYLNF